MLIINHSIVIWTLQQSETRRNPLDQVGAMWSGVVRGFRMDLFRRGRKKCGTSRSGIGTSARALQFMSTTTSICGDRQLGSPPSARCWPTHWAVVGARFAAAATPGDEVGTGNEAGICVVQRGLRGHMAGRLERNPVAGDEMMEGSVLQTLEDRRGRSIAAGCR
jgi:hypothetical protein